MVFLQLGYCVPGGQLNRPCRSGEEIIIDYSKQEARFADHNTLEECGECGNSNCDSDSKSTDMQKKKRPKAS